jgi:argininosuccinate lyase
MKLWQKKNDLDKEVEAFTIGNDPILDLSIAKFDVYGSLAHAIMLSECELLTQDELNQIRRELLSILSNIEKGDFSIGQGMEDIHSQLEQLLIKKIGVAGKKVHTARSRNDQVLVATRMFFREEIKSLTESINSLFDILIELSKEYQNYGLPGYTHFQAAMPSSFGLWFAAYAENLVDDLRQWLCTFDILNQNPLGSAAGYGTSLPINRQRTTQLLGFKDLDFNVIHAAMGRGRSEWWMAVAIAATAQTIGKMAYDLVLYQNENYGFVRLPDTFTTGSSIMPHKKNPDVFELIRARANYWQSLPAQIQTVTGNLPSGYHRDYQILKEIIFPELARLKTTLQILQKGISELEVKKNILTKKKYQLLFTVDKVNALVREGIPFREAYHMVGKEVEEGTFSIPDKISENSHEGSIGNLQNDQIERKRHLVMEQFDFSFEESLQSLIS